MGEHNSNRKQGLGPAAGAAVAVSGAIASRAWAAGSDVIRVGLLGCGGRGSGAVRDCLEADPGVVVTAVADLFEHKALEVKRGLEREERFKGRIMIKDVFSGFDCHEKLAKTDVHLILMATPPAFRGRQLMVAVQAGKHVFTEKPVATDPPGCREVIRASEIAAQKKLAIVAGTQRRHEPNRVELMKRIHDGAIGELVGGQCYWYGGGIWYRSDVGNMTELEWQCHNWYHFTWLSGDQICEQHIHNIDVMNWCFKGPPVSITAVGGRGCRDYSAQAKAVCRHFNGTEEGWERYNGDIWDHVTAEFIYPNGARVLSFSGHGPGSGRNGERLYGTKGTSDCWGSYWGESSWKYQGPGIDGQKQEHVDLIKSIRSGNPLNEGRQVAESTLTAIGGRIAAYTGRTVTWDWLLNKCKLSLVPPQEELKPGPGIFHSIATGADELI